MVKLCCMVAFCKTSPLRDVCALPAEKAVYFRRTEGIKKNEKEEGPVCPSATKSELKGRILFSWDYSESEVPCLSNPPAQDYTA